MLFLFILIIRLLGGQTKKVKRDNNGPAPWEEELMSESQLSTTLHSFDQASAVGESRSSALLIPSGGWVNNVPEVLTQTPTQTVNLRYASNGMYNFLDPNFTVEVPRIFSRSNRVLYVGTNECVIQSALRYNWNEHPW